MTPLEQGAVQQSHEGVRIPTIHLNGTSGEVLRHQHRTAVEALRRAVAAICDAAPNARDYYVQGDDAGHAALRAHEARIAALRGVREELEAITRGIETQLEGHRSRSLLRDAPSTNCPGRGMIVDP